MRSCDLFVCRRRDTFETTLGASTADAQAKAKANDEIANDEITE
jgi:hypothetical protein